MYVTPAQLTDGPQRLREVSELLGIAEDLLAVTIAAGDTSGWTPEEVAAADDALELLERYCAQATAEMDAYLAQRGYELPLDPVAFPVLVVWGRAIARYHLNDQREPTAEGTHRAERDYRNARRELDLVAKGELSLGAGDPLANAGTEDGLIQVTSNARLFTRTTLGNL